MNREKLAWTVSLVLIGLLAFSIPGTLAQRDDDYSFVRTLVDIHRQVASNYVDPVDEARLRQGAIDGMLSELDPYSMYVPPQQQEAFDRMLEGSFKGVGIQLNVTDDGKIEVVTPIDGSPAHKAGVQAGDVILKVNGEALEGLRMPEIQKKIGGPLGSEVKLTVRHTTGEEAELSMTREEIVMPTVKGYGRNADNTWDYFVCEDPKVAYLRVTQFTPDTAQNFAAAMQAMMSQGMRGMILDLRFNPGGRLDQALQMLDLLVEHGTLLVTRGRNRPESRVEASSAGTLPNFPMIVLVNEHSASASEIVAGSLQDNKRALVIGQRSYGKGSVQEVIPLDSRSGELKLTVQYYYLPSGRLVHRKKDATDWGVQPQIVVPMDNATERKVFDEMSNRELFRRPVKTTTKPTTQTAAVPSTQPMADVQLQRAVDTMMGMLVLQGDDRNAQPFAQVPQVQIGPATGPSDQQQQQQPAPVAPTTRGTIVPEEPDSTAPPAPTPGQHVVPSTAPSAAPASAPGATPATAPTTQP